MTSSRSSGPISFRPGDAATEPGLSLLVAMATELGELYGDLRGSLESIPAPPAAMAPPRGAFLLAGWSGWTVGCGGVKPIDPEICEIKRMFVAPEARGRGIGAALLAALEAEAKGLGYRRVRLDTGSRQDGARRIYEAAGYEAIADYNGNPWAAHWFEKRLGG